MSAVQRFYVEAEACRRDQPRATLHALALFDRGSGQRLLDIGCYDGSKTATIRDYLGATEAWGVDFLGDELDVARQRGVRVVVCDLNEAQRIDLDDASFE
ncbi:MAG: hypothetical protein ACRDI2_02540, partial [Chloroflexota bacterium]